MGHINKLGPNYSTINSHFLRRILIGTSVTWSFETAGTYHKVICFVMRVGGVVSSVFWSGYV